MNKVNKKKAAVGLGLLGAAAYILCREAKISNQKKAIKSLEETLERQQEILLRMEEALDKLEKDGK